MKKQKIINEGVYAGKYNFDKWFSRICSPNLTATHATVGEFKNFYRALNLASQDDQIEFCLDFKDDGKLVANPRICLIKNQSIKLQKAVVTTWPGTIRYIIENRQLMKVNSDGSLKYGSVGGLRRPSEAVQLAAVTADGRAIGYLQQPSETVIMAAIKQSNLAINYLMNNRVKLTPRILMHLIEHTKENQLNLLKDYIVVQLSKPVQVALVRENGMNICKFYKLKLKPSREVQIEAIKHNPDSISCIPDPEPELITLSEFLKQREVAPKVDSTSNINLSSEFKKENNLEEINEWFGSNNFGYVPNHNCEWFRTECTKNEQISMIHHDGMWIGCYKNPNEKLQTVAVEQNGLAIEYIKNPSPLVQLAAVKQNLHAIALIEKPHPKIVSAAISKDPWVVRLLRDRITIKEPDQLIAVRQDGRVVVYFDNVSDRVLETAITSDPDAIMWIAAHETASVNARLLELAMMHNVDVASVVEKLNIPLDEDMQLAIVSKNGLNIEFLYRKNIKPSMRIKKAAISDNPNALQYIPTSDPDHDALSTLAEFVKTHKFSS